MAAVADGTHGPDNARGSGTSWKSGRRGALATAVAGRLAIRDVAVAGARGSRPRRSNVTSRAGGSGEMRPRRGGCSCGQQELRARRCRRGDRAATRRLIGTARPREPAQRAAERRARQAGVGKRVGQAVAPLRARRAGAARALAGAKHLQPGIRHHARDVARVQARTRPRSRAGTGAGAGWRVSSSPACAQAEAISASCCSCTTRVPRPATARMRGSRLSCSNQRRRDAGSTGRARACAARRRAAARAAGRARGRRCGRRVEDRRRAPPARRPGARPAGQARPSAVDRLQRAAERRAWSPAPAMACSDRPLAADVDRADVPTPAGTGRGAQQQRQRLEVAAGAGAELPVIVHRQARREVGAGSTLRQAGASAARRSPR